MGRAWLSVERAIGTCGFAALLLLAASGAHAQECSEDADCPNGFECDLPPQAGGASPDCPPGSSCEPAPDPREQPEPRGECEPAELRCQTNADCPSGATCDLRGDDCDSTSPASGSGGDAVPASGAAGGAAPDQAAPAPPDIGCEPPTEGECVFTITECERDADCESGDVCTDFAPRECTVSGKNPACIGDDCPEPEPEPEETCADRELGVCFPKIVECDDGQACAKGTRCVAIPEDARDNPPEAFVGVEALCLPEVWALVFEERIELEGVGSSSSDSAENSAARGNTKGGTPSGNFGDDVVEPKADDGCAVRGPGGLGANASWLALACTAFWLVGRRRARGARR